MSDHNASSAMTQPEFINNMRDVYWRYSCTLDRGARVARVESAVFFGKLETFFGESASSQDFNSDQIVKAICLAMQSRGGGVRGFGDTMEDFLGAAGLGYDNRGPIIAEFLKGLGVGQWRLVTPGGDMFTPRAKITPGRYGDGVVPFEGFENLTPEAARPQAVKTPGSIGDIVGGLGAPRTPLADVTNATIDQMMSVSRVKTPGPQTPKSPIQQAVEDHKKAVRSPGGASSPCAPRTPAAKPAAVPQSEEDQMSRMAFLRSLFEVGMEDVGMELLASDWCVSQGGSPVQRTSRVAQHLSPGGSLADLQKQGRALFKLAQERAEQTGVEGPATLQYAAVGVLRRTKQ